MEEVQEQLMQGVDSGVCEPGTRITRTKNLFPTPETDVIRILDALWSQVKKGHVAGPFKIKQRNQSSGRFNTQLANRARSRRTKQLPGERIDRVPRADQSLDAEPRAGHRSR